MNITFKNLAFILVLSLPLFIINCGSNSSITGIWQGAEYDANIRNVDVVVGAYGVASGVSYIQGVAPGEATMQVSITMEPYYGFYTDQILISVQDMRIIQSGTYYPIGYNGIVAKMTVDGSPLSPSGTIQFSKFSLYYSKEVCGEFDFFISDGRAGEFHGSFCGSVQVGYDY